jgi:hypothetical protein
MTGEKEPVPDEQGVVLRDYFVTKTGCPVHVEIWAPDGDEAHQPTVVTHFLDTKTNEPVYSDVFECSQRAVDEVLEYRQGDQQAYLRKLADLFEIATDKSGC